MEGGPSLRSDELRGLLCVLGCSVWKQDLVGREGLPDCGQGAVTPPPGPCRPWATGAAPCRPGRGAAVGPPFS